MEITSQYSKPVKVTIKDHKWLMEEFKNRSFKSLAAFLEQIIEDYRKPNLFKKNGNHNISIKRKNI